MFRGNNSEIIIIKKEDAQIQVSYMIMRQIPIN